MTCPNCQSEIPVDAVVCPECGGSTGPSKEKDEAIYPELAKANLLRMRGESAAAEASLLSILKRFPNNATAHEMLGDLYFEGHDDGQALQWYELAQDLAPDTLGLGNKVARAKERRTARDEEETVEQIGLKPQTNKLAVGAAVGLVIMAIIVLSVLAILNRNKAPDVVRSTIDAPPESSAPSVSPTVAPSEKPPVGPVTTPGPAVTEEGAALALLTQRAPEGNRLLSLTSDPRSHLIQMTFGLQVGEDPRSISARLGRAALDQYPDCVVVTVRASRNGALQYVADVPRTRFNETQTQNWQSANPGDAWESHVLTNEWTASALPPKVAPSAPSTSSSPSPSSGAGSTSNIVPVTP